MKTETDGGATTTKTVHGTRKMDNRVTTCRTQQSGPVSRLLLKMGGYSRLLPRTGSGYVYPQPIRNCLHEFRENDPADCLASKELAVIRIPELL